MRQQQLPRFLRQSKRESSGESDSEREPEAAKFSSMNYTLLPCARALSGFVFVLLLLLGLVHWLPQRAKTAAEHVTPHCTAEKYVCFAGKFQFQNVMKFKGIWTFKNNNHLWRTICRQNDQININSP